MSVCVLDHPELLKGEHALIALDLDGTLLRSDKTISDFTKQAVCKAKEQGYAIVIATGRHPKSALRYLEELGCLNEKSCAICFNGAAELLMQDYIEAADEINFPVLNACYAVGDEAAAIAKFAHKYACKVHAYSRNRGLLIEDLNPHTLREINHGQVGYTAVDFENLDKNELFFKILIVGDAADLDKLRDFIPDEFKRHFEVMRSDPNFLEFIPGSSTKGTALKALCESLKVPLEQAVAFGDAENDLDMLKTAGLGIAMGNSDEYVKAQHQIFTLSNDEDGVGKAIFKLISK